MTKIVWSMLKQFHRNAHCLSCGSTFHKLIPNAPGYQAVDIKPPKGAIAAIQDNHYENILSKMSEHQKKALNLPHISAEKSTTRQALSRAKKESNLISRMTFCRPCLDSRAGKSDILRPVYSDPLECLSQLPKNSKVFHVADAMDFPMSLSPHLSKNTPNLHFVISRIDLLISHPSQVGQLKKYFMDNFLEKLGVSPSRVHTVSSLRGWEITKLTEALSWNNYFVGRANTGKTQLVQTLAGMQASQSTWPVPFITQNMTKYTLGRKLLVDMPSMPEQVTKEGIFGLITPKHLRKIGSGRRLFTSSNAHIPVPKIKGKPGQCISVCGIIALELPPLKNSGAVVHVYPIVGGFFPSQGRALSSISTVNRINSSTNENHKNWTVVNKSSVKDMNHVCDFDLKSGGELVVRGFGVLIPRVSACSSDKYFCRVYALPGVEVGERPKAMSYLFPKLTHL